MTIGNYHVYEEESSSSNYEERSGSSVRGNYNTSNFRRVGVRGPVPRNVAPVPRNLASASRNVAPVSRIVAPVSRIVAPVPIIAARGPRVVAPGVSRAPFSDAALGFSAGSNNRVSEASIFMGPSILRGREGLPVEVPVGALRGALRSGLFGPQFPRPSDPQFLGALRLLGALPPSLRRQVITTVRNSTAAAASVAQDRSAGAASVAQDRSAGAASVAQDRSARAASVAQDRSARAATVGPQQNVRFSHHSENLRRAPRQRNLGSSVRIREFSNSDSQSDEEASAQSLRGSSAVNRTEQEVTAAFRERYDRDCRIYLEYVARDRDVMPGVWPRISRRAVNAIPSRAIEPPPRAPPRNSRPARGRGYSRAEYAYLRSVRARGLLGGFMGIPAPNLNEFYQAYGETPPGAVGQQQEIIQNPGSEPRNQVEQQRSSASQETNAPSSVIPRVPSASPSLGMQITISASGTRAGSANQETVSASGTRADLTRQETAATSAPRTNIRQESAAASNTKAGISQEATPSSDTEADKTGQKSVAVPDNEADITNQETPVSDAIQDMDIQEAAPSSDTGADKTGQKSCAMSDTGADITNQETPASNAVADTASQEEASAPDKMTETKRVSSEEMNLNVDQPPRSTTKRARSESESPPKKVVITEGDQSSC